VGDASGDRMPIPGTQAREAVYWQSKDGAIVGDVQAGPPHIVRVTSRGIEIATGTAPVVRLTGAGSARWLGLRLIEAATIWEREVNTERSHAVGG
jgi:hypothetical protein